MRTLKLDKNNNLTFSNDFQTIDSKEAIKQDIKTRYYTTNLHRGAFMLPRYVEEMLEEEEK